MRRLHYRFISVSVLAALASVSACAGKAPANPGDDGPEIDAPDVVVVDAPPGDLGQRVSGKTMDYFENLPVLEATVTTDGITPVMTATSGMIDGVYSLEAVPTGSKVFLTAEHTLYRPTRNAPTTVEGVAVVEDIYIVTIQEVKNQHVLANGAQPTIGTAFLTAELRRNNGAPLEGIPLANIKLVDANDVAVPGIVGPFFYGANGSVDPALLTATAFGAPPRTRVAIFDIPPGTYSLAVTAPGGGGDVTEKVSVVAVSEGAVLARTGNLGGGGTPTPTDPLFTTDIYPRLQRASAGGLGCANCHTANGSNPALKFDDLADVTLASIKAAPGVIDLVAIDASTLLTKPLYELPPALQNHPNATFLDINDLDYKLFKLWITNGAKP